MCRITAEWTQTLIQQRPGHLGCPREIARVGCGRELTFRRKSHASHKAADIFQGEDFLFIPNAMDAVSQTADIFRLRERGRCPGKIELARQASPSKAKPGVQLRGPRQPAYSPKPMRSGWRGRGPHDGDRNTYEPAIVNLSMGVGRRIGDGRGEEVNSRAKEREIFSRRQAKKCSRDPN